MAFSVFINKSLLNLGRQNTLSLIVKRSFYQKFPCQAYLLSLNQGYGKFTIPHRRFLSEGNTLPKLTPQEVSNILKAQESTIKLKDDNAEDLDNEEATSTLSIASVDSNQLASNTPIEDTLAAARCLLTTGFLFGVFDGHGGPECSQVISKRLFEYIAAALIPSVELSKIVEKWEAGEVAPIIEVYNDTSRFIPELQVIYEDSLLKWCKQLISVKSRSFSMQEALSNAFVQLDADIGREVEEHLNTPLAESLLRIAISGAVACVLHIDGPHLHVANAGDCGAVLGVQTEMSQNWIAKRLTEDHNWENPKEVERVLSEHPKSESNYIVQNQRLLGMLMPFRAFGDFRFKWSGALQHKIIEPLLGSKELVPHCLTPPYLTCLPEITYHRLSPKDKYIIMGSDGLWEGINVLDVVTLVGEYMCGRQTLQPVRLPRRPVTLEEVLKILDQRKEGLKLKPVDTNASTHLIRHSLGGTDFGVDHARISHSLMLPPEVRRFFRDDISIHVIFLDSDFLRTCPVDL